MSSLQATSTATNLLETLKRYSLALWRWVWLALLATALGAMGGYLYSKSQTPMYMSSMRIMVVRPVQEQTSDLTRFMSNQQIAETFAQLARTPSFNQKVIERAGMIGFVSAFALPEAQFVALTVQTPNRTAAVPLLNAAAEVLADEIRAVQASRYAQIEDGLTVQIAALVLEIEKTQAAINARYAELVAVEKASLEEQIFSLEQELENLRQSPDPDSQQASQLQTRIIAHRQAYTTLLQTNRVAASRDAEVTRLERTLALYQNLYNNLTINRENVRLSKLQGTPALILVEEPVEPLVPFTPRTRRNTLLSGLAGLGLALALLVVVEYLSDTLKSAETVRYRLGVALLAQIPELQEGQFLPVESAPHGSESEAYRILRTNLAFSAIDQPLRLLLVTSAGPGEGKSILAANLAAVLSQAGRRVLLMDANLRRPSLHQLLDLQNRFGVSDAIRAADLSEWVQHYRGQNQVKFDVLTSGTLPPNPLELLASEQMQKLLEQAVERFDVVLLDAPGLTRPDAQVLAAGVDGILLVGRISRTRVDSVRSALETLTRSRGRVLGLVLNRLPGQSGYGRGGYSL